MDPTVLLYTFSAVPQTLAGAFGFLVAVVLYRMQSIEAALRSNKDRLDAWNYHQWPGAYDRAKRREDWRRMVELAEQAPIDPSHKANEKFHEEERDAFQSLVISHDSIRHRLRWSLMLTAVTIGLTLLLLAGAERIARLGWVADGLAFGSVVAAIACLVTYVRLALAVATGSARPRKKANPVEPALSRQDSAAGGR